MDLNALPDDVDPAESPDFENYRIDYDPANADLRVPGRDVNLQWFDARQERGAFGYEADGRAFMMQRPWFDEDFDKDDEWGPVRLLGSGTYGLVGLWERRDANNMMLDEVAVKQVNWTKSKRSRISDEINAGHNKPRLLREAVIQRDLNQKDERAAPHLRRYKYISDTRTDKRGRIRMYLEFCPHGSLEHLRRLYRAWDQYFPEVFVWHIFHSLAVGCEALRQPPPVDTLGLEEDAFQQFVADDAEGLYCLHMDLKPQNTLLAMGLGEEGLDFPNPKISDFGMSEYTGRSDLRNPDNFWWRGTTAYKPTEQLFYGAEWRIPPNGAVLRTHDRRGKRVDFKRAKQAQREDNATHTVLDDICFDHSLNVYGVGATMYSVATLCRTCKLMDTRAKHYAKYRQNGNHQISKVRTKVPGTYSSRLRRLIHRCLDPDPANRPSQVELMDETHRGLQLAIRRVKRARRDAALAAAGGDPNNLPPGPPPPLPSEKIYYHDHEINDMPLGNAGFRPKKGDYRNLVFDQFVNPDIPRLKLPPAKYNTKFPPAMNEMQLTWRTLYPDANDGNLWFKPVN
ncbi:hypothetical protein ABEF92_008341 [Exophiala dermatitidis]|uniref:non-specific serine/threonine protein kinase n=1 Tax=Exophiala dermatitidis (strain ATCC 34100 / CBS 525.76 / NIH/UT8656) TaxID=858893 RepID=H6BS89_EXODN|nr:uncharacterized protein HMPREF1120_02319 [Exophiala dermatitidis NIH/UT8656]EHY54144.1 hypothetical protein HMPREF1120_02319 [Exophiala dermatitidis NIH/UT8656]